MNVDEFVFAELPDPPVRVLEVGCGGGELARALAAAGYDVLAVDPDAPDGPLFRRTKIEELEDPGPFAAAVASRSLHHVHDLAVALDKIVGLLGPGGCVVLDDFGWERLDARSAVRVGIELAEWREEHAGLHTSEAIVRELDRRLSRRRLVWGPDLYREERAAVTWELERNLIETGELEAIGFRYVGARYDPR